MSEWPLLKAIIGREYRAWKKPFLISTLIILVVVGAGIGVASVVASNTDPPSFAIATAGDTPAGFRASVAEFLPDGSTLETVQFTSAAAAESAVRAGMAEVAVVDDDIVIWGTGVTDALSDGVVQTLVLAQVRRRAAELGVSPGDAERLLQPQFDFREANPVSDGDSQKSDEVAAVFSTIIMFMAILAYGQWIGYAVVEEKANRVVEVLLGAIRPHQLMGAKVLSIGSLGLAQLASVGALVLAVGLATNNVALPAVRGATVFWVLLWFLLGYAFYGSLYAAAGSLASNTQEAGSTIGPLAILVAIGYITGLVSFGEGFDTAFLQIMSLIPLWSPLLMPGRVVRGWAAPWEVALSLTIMVAATYGMLRLAGWVYTGGVARATQKLGWREALRAGRELRSR